MSKAVLCDIIKYVVLHTSSDKCIIHIHRVKWHKAKLNINKTTFLLARLSEKKAAIAFSYDENTPAEEKEGDSDAESSDTDVETADLGKPFQYLWQIHL